jgi:hypothetical protein
MEHRITIPEEVVAEAASSFGEEDNNFRRMWEAGQEYKLAGMTPIYLLDQERMDLYVVAAETYGKKLN